MFVIINLSNTKVKDITRIQIVLNNVEMIMTKNKRSAYIGSFIGWIGIIATTIIMLSQSIINKPFIERAIGIVKDCILFVANNFYFVTLSNHSIGFSFQQRQNFDRQL